MKMVPLNQQALVSRNRDSNYQHLPSYTEENIYEDLFEINHDKNNPEIIKESSYFNLFVLTSYIISDIKK